MPRSASTRNLLGWCVAYTYKISNNSVIIGYHFQCVSLKNPNFQCVSFSEGPEEVVIAIEVLFPTMQESTSDTYIVKCKISLALWWWVFHGHLPWGSSLVREGLPSLSP